MGKRTPTSQAPVVVGWAYWVLLGIPLGFFNGKITSPWKVSPQDQAVREGEIDLRGH